MPASEPVLCCVDMGTTRLRVWVVEGDVVWARAATDVGARDVAGKRSRTWLCEQLSRLIDVAISQAVSAGLLVQPSAVLAAGMITSDQGLVEIPHIDVPAGLTALAVRLHAEELSLFERESLPLFLVPGVRSGSSTAGVNAVLSMDLMRGEETLSLGLMAQGRLDEQTLLLNLGSHWKLIWFDAQQRIVGSHTSLSGELIHAIQAHTLLASSLPQHVPDTLEEDWVLLGYDEAARSGLGRALFCTRLLDLCKFGTDDQRLSFVYGCFLHGEMVHLASLQYPHPIRLLIAGSAPMAEMCASLAGRLGIVAETLSEDDREQAYLHGLRALYRAYKISSAELQNSRK